MVSNDLFFEVRSTGDDTDPDAILRALASPRCRYLLALAQGRDGSVSLEDAAADICEWEHGCDPGELAPETRERVLISLYHSKVPRLADVGLVEFDPDELAVEISEAGETITPMLDLGPVE